MDTPKCRSDHHIGKGFSGLGPQETKTNPVCLLITTQGGHVLACPVPRFWADQACLQSVPARTVASGFKWGSLGYPFKAPLSSACGPHTPSYPSPCIHTAQTAHVSVLTGPHLPRNTGDAGGHCHSTATCVSCGGLSGQSMKYNPTDPISENLSKKRLPWALSTTVSHAHRQV